MTPATFRKWTWLHKWSSLICTLFLLTICLSGLPLVFSHEIHELIEHHHGHDDAKPDDGKSHVSLDGLVEEARRLYPGHLMLSVFLDDEAPHAIVRLIASYAELDRRPTLIEGVRFDLRNGAVVSTFAQERNEAKPMLAVALDEFMRIMIRVHIDLFAGLAGQLFLGLMALLFVVALVSGAVLYGPFMKRTAFGTVRTQRAPRLKWLDLHNLLGIVTLAWALVVGVTGVINELARPLNIAWRAGVRAELGLPLNKGAPPLQATMVPVQGVFDTARAALPGMRVMFAGYPNQTEISAEHFIIRAVGETALTKRLSTFALVDVATGRLTKVLEMPWYLTALQLSRPLHFGDYGGLPLKIIWALLDLVTIFVLGSGLYLWWKRRPSAPLNRRAAE
ncbi:MAG: PepSY-associated TM helix domain-containing protein [Pseudolabrys sp.]|nr:PepSY-associated TM helix domain-containing protein [Pseudolabrys sp.]